VTLMDVTPAGTVKVLEVVMDLMTLFFIWLLA
jgi:hypothetical protein